MDLAIFPVKVERVFSKDAASSLDCRLVSCARLQLREESAPSTATETPWRVRIEMQPVVGAEAAFL